MPVKRKDAGEPKRPSGATQENDLGLPLDQVRALIDLLEERGLEEFELEREGVRIRIKRRGAPAAPAPVFESYVGNPALSPGAEPVRPAAAGDTAPPDTTAVLEDLHLIKSPIVGTFYSAPRPDAPPFVQVGDQVEVGQVLCIVEAMKLMNEIESDVAGEVVRVYMENGQAVEYGETLFALRPARR